MNCYMFAHALDTMQCLPHINISPTSDFPWHLQFLQKLLGKWCDRFFHRSNLGSCYHEMRKNDQCHRESDVRGVNKDRLLAFDSEAFQNVCDSLPQQPSTSGGLTLHPLRIW